MKKALIGGTLITADGLLEHHAIVFDKTIVAIVAVDSLDTSTVQVIPYEGYLSPGFIDIHIHGCSGKDVMDGTPEALEVLSRDLLQSGTTAFLATTMTMAQSVIGKAVDNVRRYLTTQSDDVGAQIIGVHLEGPYINPDFKGAQEATYIQKPNIEFVLDNLDVIKVVTYAPERDDDLAFTHALKDKVVLSIGHTGADYDTAVKAFDAGAQHITHCFNAMTGLHHRHPGVVGAALAKDFSIDLISDAVHVHPDLFAPIFSMKKPDKRVLITDAMRAAFLGEGEYDLGGQAVVVKDGVCQLADGTIAGSVHRMDNALRNMLEHTDFSLVEVVNMLSYNPANVLGVADERGQLITDARADFVVLSDNFEVKQVFVGGKLQ